MKYNSCICLIALVLFSCSSSRKFDFTTAYKFSTHKYTQYEEIAQVPEVSAPDYNRSLIVSRNQTIGHIPRLPNRLPLHSSSDNRKNISKKERRQIFKEIKQIGRDLRKLRKTDPATAEIEAQKATKELTGKIYAGTVIGIAGLVLLILDIASPLGVLAFVVGLALVVWGLLERGSFG